MGHVCNIKCVAGRFRSNESKEECLFWLPIYSYVFGFVRSVRTYAYIVYVRTYGGLDGYGPWIECMAKSIVGTDDSEIGTSYLSRLRWNVSRTYVCKNMITAM